MLRIDGMNIKTTWGIAPQLNGVFNQVLQKPNIKPRYSNDWGDEDFIEVDDSANVLDKNELTLSFIGDTVSGYNEFIDYLIEHPTVNLSIDEVNVIVDIDYLECSSFNQYSEFNTFSVKFLEKNPMDRDVYYIITNLGEYLIDNNGNNLII